MYIISSSFNILQFAFQVFIPTNGDDDLSVDIFPPFLGGSSTARDAVAPWPAMRRAAVALARRVHLITCEESAQQWCEKYLEASVAGKSAGNSKSSYYS